MDVAATLSFYQSLSNEDRIRFKEQLSSIPPAIAPVVVDSRNSQQMAQTAVVLTLDDWADAYDVCCKNIRYLYDQAMAIMDDGPKTENKRRYLVIIRNTLNTVLSERCVIERWIEMFGGFDEPSEEEKREYSEEDYISQSELDQLIGEYIN